MEISLALGGGGAKGFAHLGVLVCLERHGYQVRAIAGTSAGGIVASIYAAGYSPAEMLERFTKIDQSTLYGHRPGELPAILGVAGMNQILQEMIGERTFDQLKIPCALAAVDLATGEEVILHSGRVIDATLATMALPGIFPPHPWEGRYLVDGGILDPVPVQAARRLAPQLPIVAVVLSSLDPHPVNYLDPPAFLDALPLLRQVARLKVAQAFNIFMHSIDISSRQLTALRLKVDHPEIIIQPDLNHIGILDQVDILEVASRGEKAVEAALPELRRVTSWASRMKRHLRVSLNG